MIHNQFQLNANVNFPHIPSNIEATAEPVHHWNNGRVAKRVPTEVNDDWLQATSKWKQPSNDFVTDRCSSNPTQDYFYPVKKATLEAMRKLRNKVLVLPFRMHHDFFARMALLGQFHHIEIKVAFTLKTTLMVLELFLDLLPILWDSRERQKKQTPTAWAAHLSHLARRVSRCVDKKFEKTVNNIQLCQCSERLEQAMTVYNIRI